MVLVLEVRPVCLVLQAILVLQDHKDPQDHVDQ